MKDTRSDAVVWSGATAALAVSLIVWSCANRDERTRTTLPTPLVLDAAAEPEAPPPDAAPFIPPVSIEVTKGLSAPAFAIYDSLSRTYLVANVNVEGGKDNDGYIARVSPDGDVVDPRWIEGGKRGVSLHDPRGMVVWGGILYVADLDTLRRFDRETGEPLGGWRLPRAQRLSDVAVSLRGVVYVVDWGADSAEAALPGGVYRFASPADDDAEMVEGVPERPGGIVVEDERLVLVSRTSSELVRQEPSGSLVTIAKLPSSGLEGLVAMAGGAFLVSSRDRNAVFHVDPQGRVTTLFEGLSSPSSLGYDRTRLRVLIPLLHHNSLLIRTLPTTSSQTAEARD